jgi:hypothetical protein
MSDIPAPTDRLTGDLLWGAKRIGEHIDRTAGQVYYLHKSGKLPLGKMGKVLIGSKSKLTSHTHKIASGSTA